ncbi:MAG TPA: hypothetical protein PLK80_06075 [bacterium]|nr:MAG: hypothetical protein BWY28_00297 [bacterium ADurb.Bin236]HOC92948.1 hypothetical protein [bacterium]HOY63734.1 hypothetical protein [bacterium]HPI76284.1 hypothetical protein [bacterium]
MDRLYWDIYAVNTEDFPTFIDRTSSHLHIYLGDVREAVAHTDQISKYGRVIYNQQAWDTDKFKEIKDEVTQPNHYDVIKETILRVNKYKCDKVDMGYVGRWKNPYQIADTHLPTGITISYEKRPECHFIRTVFFSPEHWFNLQCKPLFRTDPIVEKEPKGSWNMNPVGLIAPKPEKSAANRRAMFNIVSDFIKEFRPAFTGLGLSQFYFNFESGNAYLTDNEAKEREDLLPLIFSFREDGNRPMFSDSTEIPIDNFDNTLARDQRMFFDRRYFEFL